jgi:hypothetical protein
VNDTGWPRLVTPDHEPSPGVKVGVVVGVAVGVGVGSSAGSLAAATAAPPLVEALLLADSSSPAALLVPAAAGGVGVRSGADSRAAVAPSGYEGTVSSATRTVTS